MTEKVDFALLNMEISSLVKTYPVEQQQHIFEYLNEMDDLHKQAYHIAYDHLKSSFNIARSNGFKEWLSKKQT